MKLAKDVGLILLLALLWFGSAYYAGEAILPAWGLQCGLGSLVTGLIGLAIIHRTEEGRRLLYEGESSYEDIGCAKIVVWLVIALPFTLLVMGTLWWLLRWLGLFELE
jgi:hypothetical protein